MSCVQVPIVNIPGNECVGDSLIKINGNFESLADSSCFLLSSVNELDLRVDVISSLASSIIGTGIIQISNGGTGEQTAEAARLALGAGTVSSISFSPGSTNFTIQPSEITTSGTFTLGGVLATGHGGTGTTTALSARVFAGPSTGVAAAPTFRPLLSSDIPKLDASQIISGMLNSSLIPPIGTVELSGIIAVSQGGTGTATVSPNNVFAGPLTGTTAQPPSFRNLAASDIPNLNADKITSGTLSAARLPFIPVQQGGGNLQGTNKLFIGWSAGLVTGIPDHLRLQIDTTNFGGDWPLRLHANRITDGVLNINRIPVAEISSILNVGLSSTFENITETLSGAVTVTDNQLIGGEKTFLNNPVIRNSAPTLRLQDNSGTPRRTGFVQVNESNFYILRGASDGTTWDDGPNNRHPLTLSLENGNAVFSGDVTAFSDKRLKTNIKTIENALEKTNALRGVTFERIQTKDKCIGVIGQEIKEILPEVVHEDKDGYLSVSYGNIVGLLIEAIKELTNKIEILEKSQLK